MEAATQKRYTLEEYLEMEYHSDRRHYFYDGMVNAMTYTSDNHGLIVANLIMEIGSLAKQTEFRVYPSDRMLYVPECNLNYYPDVMVVKGEPQMHRHSPRMEATLNPYAILEVLSDSTEERDRVDKWPCYRTIPSLQQYILIAQDRPYIEFFNRIEGSRWENDYVDQLSQIISVAGFDIAVADVYLKAKWEKPDQNPDH